MSILEITNLTHQYGDTPLFSDAALCLNKGEHVGVVGPNGAGKSTLLNICTGLVIPDAGRIAWQPGVAVGCLDQHASIDAGLTLQAFLRSAFQDLYHLDRELQSLYQQAADGDETALNLAARHQSQLEQRDFYTVDTRVEQVAEGLGLRAVGLERPVSRMSGGQRAKALLAKLLLEQPDVMLLDEPTNFLDKAHIAWLADYLHGLENAFLVVSHDHDFLDRVADRIVDIDNRKLAKYHGGYAQFLQKKTLLRSDYVRRYAAQQREIKQTEEFIRRNIAGRKTRMAQGRRKQLARMDRMEALSQSEIRPRFHFAALPAADLEHLCVSRLAVGYHYPVLRGIDFTVKGGQKVVVTGFNGIGKSTLFKTLAGLLPALRGGYRFADQARIGYFAQDLAWESPSHTPLQIIADAFPALTAKDARRHLAHCGISARHAMQAVGTLSGGEQAKLKLCLLTLEPCNLLLLDEPTNHLDALAKQALQDALVAFPGTVLLVSHEEAFYRAWANRVIDIAKGI